MNFYFKEGTVLFCAGGPDAKDLAIAYIDNFKLTRENVKMLKRGDFVTIEVKKELCLGP